VAGVTESVHKDRAATARKRKVSDSLSSPKFVLGSPLRVLRFILPDRPGAGRQRPIGLDNIIEFLVSGFSFRLQCQRETRNGKLETGVGAVAQLGERLICIQEVAGSIPTSSTRFD
jgi:hypothetical protein